MKKETLIQKVQERFANHVKNVAIVVTYNDKKYSACPYNFENPFFSKRNTIEQIKPFYYGEIVEEQQELCGNPEFQFLTYRAESCRDIFRFAFHCTENWEDIMFDSFQQSNSVFDSPKGRLVAPSNLSLIEIKKLMWEIAEKYEIPDVHILIQSVDYPVFGGLRDRQSPNP